MLFFQMTDYTLLTYVNYTLDSHDHTLSAVILHPHLK